MIFFHVRCGTTNTRVYIIPLPTKKWRFNRRKLYRRFNQVTVDQLYIRIYEISV
jgi:hypothetical protein